MRRVGLALPLLLAVALAGRAAAEERPPGFRLDVTPRVDPVFGGVEALRGAVDEFDAAAAEMARLDEEFALAVVAGLAALRGGGRGCPAGAAAPYARAFQLGRRYHELGARLESLHATIRELDDLGETRGLTPDHRLRVARARETYPRLLRDFAEMRAAFQGQLTAEARYAGCVPAELVAGGEEAATRPTPAPPPPPTPAPPRLADRVVFFVDNQGCGRPQRVVVDGELAGEVAPGARAAFRGAAGGHRLCVLDDAAARCGDVGTARRVVLHDGWTITVRCQ